MRLWGEINHEPQWQGEESLGPLLPVTKWPIEALLCYHELSQVFCHLGEVPSCLRLRGGTSWGIVIHFHVRCRLWYL